MSLSAAAFFALFSLPLPAGEEAPHWGYSGAQGPGHWAELAEAFSMCAEGRNQSPIDLVADVAAELPELVFDYHGSNVNETNNVHGIQQNVKPGSFLRIPQLGKSFELKQFHFHSPSEHTIEGKPFAMEVHFVHANDSGALAVVGVMIEEGEENPVLAKLWAFMPQEVGQTVQEPVGIEETGLLPPTREYFSYSGSLTTPPCSEGVRWVVLKTPIEASADQIATFKQRVGFANNRPVQAHNARLVLD
jgi:carbonic anhydrase